MDGKFPSLWAGTPWIPTAIDFGKAVYHRDCPRCVVRGKLRVSPFVWDSTRHLHWLCQSCRHVWVEPDPRTDERMRST